MAHQVEKVSVEIHARRGSTLEERYFDYVRTRWVRSYRRGCNFIKLIDAAAYQEKYYPHITSILKRPRTVVRLALLSDDHDVTLGYSVAEDSVLHYIEVANGYRLQGIGRVLLPTKVDYFTHITRTGLRLCNRFLPQARFNPFLG